MKLYPAYEWFLTPHWVRRFGPLKLIQASLLDRVGLHFFTLYSSLNGVLTGALGLAGVVLTERLGATDLQMGIYTALSVVVMLLGIVGSELVEGRDKRPYILTLGLLSRGALFLFLLCYNAWLFIVVGGLFFVLNALLMPAIFSMWQSNISAEARGKLWGLAVIVTTLVMMAAAYGVGKVLDWNPDSFRWLFPVAGVVAMLGIVTLAISPLRGAYKLSRAPQRMTLRSTLIAPVQSFVRLLAEDRKYLNFELVFFLYGLAVMLLFPIIPIYIVEVAEMTYGQASIATLVIGQLGVLALPPLWGMLMDRTGPMFLCMVVFAVLALFPLILLVGLGTGPGTALTLGVVYLAHLVFGIGMSGVHVAWSMGPVMFAGSRDASGYSGAHVTITGIRGLIGPMLGALGKMYFGFLPVLVVSAALFTVASLGMYLLRRHYGPLRPPVSAEADAA